FSALVRLSPARAIPFIARFIEDRDADVREGALTALGESRHEKAFEVLREKWEADFSADRRLALIGPMALLRLPPAIDFQLGLAETASPAIALSVLEAMRMYRHDGSVKSRLANALRAGGHPEAVEKFERMFSD